MPAPDQKKPKPDLPESTLRIMERMVKTPPKPHEKGQRPKVKIGKKDNGQTGRS